MGPENPHAIGFCSKETDLTHELAAIRNVNVEASRIWKIKNESVRNRLTGLSYCDCCLCLLSQCHCTEHCSDQNGCNAAYCLLQNFEMVVVLQMLACFLACLMLQVHTWCMLNT